MNRKELRARARHRQDTDFENRKVTDSDNTAILNGVDPSTGLDQIRSLDGGSGVAHRLFDAGHPPGTLVQSLKGGGSRQAVDWRDSIPAETPKGRETARRRRSKSKELEPSDVAVLFFTTAPQDEPESCNCTTYKRNAEGKFQEVCDGSGLKNLPNNGNMVNILRIADKSVPITEVDVAAIYVEEREPFLSATSEVLAQIVKDLLTQGSSIIIQSAARTHFYRWSDPAYLAYIGATELASEAQKETDTLAIYRKILDEVLKPSLKIDVTPVFNEWRYCGEKMSMAGLGSDTVTSTISSSLVVSKINTPNSVGDIAVRIFGSISAVGNTSSHGGIQNAGAIAAANFPVGPGWYYYFGDGDRKKVLGFEGAGDAVAVGDTYGYLLYWEAAKIDKALRGVVVLDVMPELWGNANLVIPGNASNANIPSRSGGWYSFGGASLADSYARGEEAVIKLFNESTLSRLASSPSYSCTPRAMSYPDPVSGEMLSTVFLEPTASTAFYCDGQFHEASNGSRIGDAVLRVEAIKRNITYWIPPRQKNTVPPSKETLTFWIGGCYKTPIKITELTKDDPYDAYLSNTPEQIFVTIKASKQHGFKDLEMKKRPWCSITTWVLDKLTGTLTSQKFENPDPVTTNQDDWQKEWAHNYDPIPPMEVSPARFNIATTRFGVSTAPQTFSLAPFIKAADPALPPRLTNISFTSVTSGGGGSVTSWDANALTFVYQGSATTLYSIEFSYTVDDGASSATSTISLSGTITAPNMIFQYLGIITDSVYRPAIAINLTSGDHLGNRPQVAAGKTLSLVSVTLVSMGVENGTALNAFGGTVTTPARRLSGFGVNPTGVLESVNLAGLSAVWRDYFAVVPGRSSGAVTSKLSYTVSDGTDTRDGFIFVYVDLVSPF